MQFRCNCGATGVERMEFVLLIDCCWSISSRGWTDITRSGQAFPHGKDVQHTRTIRSQEFILSLSTPAAPSLKIYTGEGPPLSYGCVVGRLYLFRGEKSGNASFAELFWQFDPASWCNLGAINAKNDQKERICWRYSQKLFRFIL